MKFKLIKATKEKPPINENVLAINNYGFVGVSHYDGSKWLITTENGTLQVVEHKNKWWQWQRPEKRVIYWLKFEENKEK